MTLGDLYNNVKKFGKGVFSGEQYALPYANTSKDKNFAQTGLKKVYNFGAGVVNHIATDGIIRPFADISDNIASQAYGIPTPQYNQMKSGAFKLGTSLAGQGAKNPQQLLGDIGQTALPILEAWGGGKIVGAAQKGFVAPTLSALAKNSAKQGFRVGGINGLAQGFNDNRNADLPTFLLNSGISGVAGAGFGAGLGFATPYAGAELGKLTRDIGKFADPNTILNPAKKYINTGSLISSDGNYPKMVDPRFFEPESLLFKGVMKTEGLPVGMSIKDVSGDFKPGQFVKNIKRGNFGKIVSINNEKGTAQVFFKNKSNKTKATVEIPLSELQGKGGQMLPDGIRSPRPFIERPTQGPNTNLKLNSGHLRVDQKSKQFVDETIDDLKPSIEKIVGKRMSNQEVTQLADRTSSTLEKTIGSEQTLRLGAEALNLRRQVAAAAKDGKVTPEFIEALKKDKAFSTNIARLMQQRSIDVDPLEKTQMQAMIEAVLAKNDKTDEILKAADGVDFNDARQAAAFYRQFVKPSAEEWVDLIRYNSMLSSPNTHIINSFSNAVNSGVVAPIEKTVSGAVDFLGSKILKKERTQFAGEGAAYVKGYMSSIGEASHRFADVMRGKRANTNLDLRNIQLKPGSKVEGALSVPTKLLEGMDQFFTALAYGGEKNAFTYREGKGIKVPNLELKAQDKAAYRLFRQDLHSEDQGGLLNAIDYMTSKLMNLRSLEAANDANQGMKLGASMVRNIAKWTIPFIKTPMNILKQGVEYFPLGFGTIPGAANKTEQISKAIIGSTVFAGAGMMLESGRLTWAEPVNEKQKNAFRAAGMQPYSVKIGNKWYSYQKLAPGIAFPLALIAAIDDTQKNRKLGDDTVDQILTAVAKYGQFLSDQSYAKNVGDLLVAAKGGESGIARLISNYPQQMVPYRAALGWIARLTDDTQRKVDPEGNFVEKQVQSLMMNIPGLSDNVPARQDQFGKDIKSPDNIINAFLPIRVSTENKKNVSIYNA